ncbi:hypothetical protein E2L08_01110 [Palleronia sediminis]|uniref:Uncharacterized protein n=1 Tax=Palleronia sediminis TaxID=2547833 RepID=A0A4R6AL87_9RHOB|nr:hypothetical protein [Palleronia sediminis]TDL84102.1 hypothetical protein E2L08_01110 [Palleronia sediminis]
MSTHTLESATLDYAFGTSIGLRDIGGIVAQALRQSGAVLHDIDLGFFGDSLSYGTDYGRVNVVLTMRASGTPKIEIACDVDRRGTPATARRLCYLLASRFVAQTPVRDVVWHATGQRIAAEDFTWGALRGVGHRIGLPSASIVPTHDTLAFA